ncbi:MULTISPECIES: SepM family pheromone-processing serine protease [unclassified Virgibacillus]|uniref:SepM family pheromone-processing serine protease n=1 Tax=unclassified Virgibacillus TaxID=2620237 RepID=UPI0024DED95C|nr:SepM family pheromone-processing serine protease [Virgibacillus sp. LDC-1]
MKFTKRQLVTLVLMSALVLFLSMYKLPFYIYKPGGADALNPIVEVEGGHKSKGDMHLVTVRGGQATPMQFILAKLLPHQEVLPLHEVRPEGVSEEAYFQAQLQMMESSQEASTVVAYKAANEQIKIEYNGVYVVSVVEGMPADGQLKSGDRIIGIDSKKITEAKDLIDFVDGKQAGDSVQLKIVRDDKELTKEVTLETFQDDEEKVGLGIQLVTDRSVEVNPNITFASGSIGGPSAGLMFSLEIYDQLVEEDITKGYQIAGTGEIDYDGRVYRIGGIDKKVIAADKEGCDIFFAPNEGGAANSNYEIAIDTVNEIDSDMKIVPVDSFQDAIDYLETIDTKK